MSWVGVIFTLGGILLAVILALTGQLMLANGFLVTFDSVNSFGAPSPVPNDLTEPTFQSYGEPTIASPPSSEGTKEQYCRQCGTFFLKGAQFCGHCGLTR